MAVLYATNEFEIRRQALADAIRCGGSAENIGVPRETVDMTLARADAILEWYTRAADTQETSP